MRYVALYLAAIVAANLIVAWQGAWVTPITAFVFIGFDLTCRDYLHEAWHGRALWPKMLALIATGSVISYLLNQNAWRIAVASVVAFALAGVADALVYQRLIKRSRLTKINGSNVVSSAVDSFLFPTVAFGAFLPGIILAQFAAKVGGGFLWSLVLQKRTTRQTEVNNG